MNDSQLVQEDADNELAMQAIIEAALDISYGQSHAVEMIAEAMHSAGYRKIKGPPSGAMTTAYKQGQQARVDGQPYEVWSDDSPVTLAFWDGYYGRPLQVREWPCM